MPGCDGLVAIGYDWGMRLGDLLHIRAAAAILATGLLIGASACSSDDEPDEPTASVTPDTPAGTPAGTPGPRVEADSATFEAPGGFDLGEATGEGATIATGPSGALVSLVEVDFPGEAPETERQAEIALDGLGGKFEMEEPVEVDGIEMWHLSGKESKGGFVDVYGAVVDGTAVRLTLRLGNEEYDVEERAAVNEQVLASWTWSA